MKPEIVTLTLPLKLAESLIESHRELKQFVLSSPAGRKPRGVENLQLHDIDDLIETTQAAIAASKTCNRVLSFISAGGAVQVGSKYGQSYAVSKNNKMSGGHAMVIPGSVPVSYVLESDTYRWIENNQVTKGVENDE